ncbi:hypothetical protein QNH47_09910 [Virgibacillus halodenitrificans]|uniref:hypothetical protein n=1 Tax=Virgibacillus halodenitrificans TaxID=1482 RepID=UPI0024BF61B4|nr:hypothetical protein [Virgibacillus halodenitrificans]WHX24514.1 hypothetical protein QNH47_09910 [Virgibacillus halodenitrificans]
MDKLAQIRLISVQQKRSNGQTRVVPHENCPIEAIVKYLVGKTSFDHAIILLTRVGAFYFIGLLIGLDQTNSIVVGGGVALIILVLELLFKLRENNRKEK